jgi:hypothetical protein
MMMYTRIVNFGWLVAALIMSSAFIVNLFAVTALSGLVFMAIFDWSYATYIPMCIATIIMMGVFTYMVSTTVDMCKKNNITKTVK